MADTLERDHTHGGEDDGPDPKEALKEVIRVELSDAGVLRKRMSVTVPRESIQSELDREYKQIISDAIVPGFRRGRAPRRLIEKRFGSDVGDQVQTRILSNAYLAAIEKESIDVLGDPLIWVNEKDKADQQGRERLVDMATALQHLKLPAEGDFSFRCEVEVKPKFEIPGLEGVAIERPELTISDEDVDVEIERIRARRGNWAPVFDGKVEADDLLICDVTIEVNGQEYKKLENHPVPVRAQRIEGIPLEDIGEKLEGAKVGDTRKVNGEVPDDFEVEVHRGKKAAFEIKVLDIKRFELPPLDKGFLESQGFDSEKELREFVKTQMDARLAVEIKRGLRNQVREYLLKQTELELPEGLSSRQTDRAAVRMAVEMQRSGIPLEEIEKKADEIRTSAREETTKSLKLHFVLEKIAEKLDISVTEEEMNQQISAIAQAYHRRFDRVRDDLARNNGIEALYLDIRDDKCLDWVVGRAKITDKPVERKTPEKPAAKKAPAGGKKADEAREKPAAKSKAADEGKKETRAPAKKPAPKKK